MTAKLGKDAVDDFLYWRPRGKEYDFPHENVYIGVEFEVGGCHEDWGWVVVEFNYDKDKNAYNRQVISSGRTKEIAIERAKERYGK